MNNPLISISAIIVLLAGAGNTLYMARSRSGLFLSAALFSTALLELVDLLSLNATANSLQWKQIALVIESLLPLCWIFSSLTFARQPGPLKISLLNKVAIVCSVLIIILPLIIPLNLFYYAPDFPGEKLLFLGSIGYYFYFAIMACLVVALINLEVTLSNATPDSRWKIKYVLLGLGSIIAVQIFYFSQALLYRSLSMNFLPLRSFMYLIGSAMIAFSFTRHRINVRIQISRQVAFKSFVLFVIAAYLVVLGLLGEGMHHFSSLLPRTVTVSLGFLLGIILIVLLLSERLRREVKVVLHKNFYQHKHDYRTQWLRFTEQLSTSRSGDELLQRILSAYCDIFGITGAALFLFEENRRGYCLVAEHNMKLGDEVLAPENTLLQFMISSSWVVNIGEENPLIAAEDFLFFVNNDIYFVVPLFGEMWLEGFIVLGRQINVNETYIYEDYDLMKTIARQASLAILHQKLSEQITHSREIEAIGNVSTFVAHDLKNLVSNLSLIVENAARHIHNPEFQKDMLESLENTVTKMQKLISRLKRLGEQDHMNLQNVDLLQLAQRTVKMFMANTIVVTGTPEKVNIDENEIQKVILNLLMNAVESSTPQDSIEVEVGFSKCPYLRVTDHGCGMSPRFLRYDLFKPFRTSKKLGLGIGLYQCQQIVSAHGGKIEVTSIEGSGSVFTVWFSDNENTVNRAL